MVNTSHDDVVRFCDDLYTSILCQNPGNKATIFWRGRLNNRNTISTNIVKAEGLLHSLESRRCALLGILSKDTFKDTISKRFSHFSREEHRNRRRLRRYKDYLDSDLELLCSIIVALHLELRDECSVLDRLLLQQFSFNELHYATQWKGYHEICIEQLNLPEYGFTAEPNKLSIHYTDVATNLPVKDYCCTACLVSKHIRLVEEKTHKLMRYKYRTNLNFCGNTVDTKKQLKGFNTDNQVCYTCGSVEALAKVHELKLTIQLATELYSTMRIKLLQAVYLLDGYEKAMSCARRGPDIDTKIFEKLSMYSFTPSEGNSDTNQQSVLMFCELPGVVLARNKKIVRLSKLLNKYKNSLLHASHINPATKRNINPNPDTDASNGVVDTSSVDAQGLGMEETFTCLAADEETEAVCNPGEVRNNTEPETLPRTPTFESVPSHLDYQPTNQPRYDIHRQQYNILNRCLNTMNFTVMRFRGYMLSVINTQDTSSSIKRIVDTLNQTLQLMHVCHTQFKVLLFEQLFLVAREVYSENALLCVSGPTGTRIESAPAAVPTVDGIEYLKTDVGAGGRASVDEDNANIVCHSILCAERILEDWLDAISLVEPAIDSGEVTTTGNNVNIKCLPTTPRCILIFIGYYAQLLQSIITVSPSDTSINDNASSDSRAEKVIAVAWRRIVESFVYRRISDKLYMYNLEAEAVGTENEAHFGLKCRETSKVDMVTNSQVPSFTDTQMKTPSEACSAGSDATASSNMNTCPCSMRSVPLKWNYKLQLLDKALSSKIDILYRQICLGEETGGSKAPRSPKTTVGEKWVENNTAYRDSNKQGEMGYSVGKQLMLLQQIGVPTTMLQCLKKMSALYDCNVIELLRKSVFKHSIAQFSLLQSTFSPYEMIMLLLHTVRIAIFEIEQLVDVLSPNNINNAAEPSGSVQERDILYKDDLVPSPCPNPRSLRSVMGVDDLLPYLVLLLLCSHRSTLKNIHLILHIVRFYELPLLNNGCEVGEEAYYVTCFDAALDYLLYFKFDFEIEEGNVEASTHSVTSAVTAMVSNPLYKACDMRYADDECVPILTNWIQTQQKLNLTLHVLRKI